MHGKVARAVVASALLAGCLAGPADDGERTGPGPDDGGSAAEPPSLLWLTSEMELVPYGPQGDDPVPVPIPAFYDRWVAGGTWPSWSARLTGAAAIVNASVTFFYRSEGATPTTGPGEQGFPEFVVYLGVGEAYMGSASVEGPDVVRDETVEVSATFELPRGGLVLDAGDDLTLLIVPVQGSTADGTRIEVLTDALSTPSRVELLGAPARLSRLGWIVEEDTEVRIVGSAYVTTQGGLSKATVPVTLSAHAAGLRVHMERTGGAGGADLDLAVYDQEGERVGRSATPQYKEDLRLLAPNLAGLVPGEWTVEVAQYGGAVATARVRVEVGEAAGSPA